jgi:hypothetical protein
MVLILLHFFRKKWIKMRGNNPIKMAEYGQKMNALGARDHHGHRDATHKGAMGIKIGLYDPIIV